MEQMDCGKKNTLVNEIHFMDKFEILKQRLFLRKHCKKWQTFLKARKMLHNHERKHTITAFELPTVPKNVFYF